MDDTLDCCIVPMLAITCSIRDAADVMRTSGRTTDTRIVEMIPIKNLLTARNGLTAPAALPPIYAPPAKSCSSSFVRYTLNSRFLSLEMHRMFCPISSLLIRSL